MKTYELAYIISPEMTSEEASAKAQEIESAIRSREGTIVKQLNPVARTLSYQIEKRASGYFGVIEFQLEPEKLLEVKDIIVKDKKIVRHMLVIKEAVEFKKARRTRETTKAKVEEGELSVFATTPKIEVEAPTMEEEEEPSPAKKEVKEKVELKDIEHELDEILGE
jgi:ribosomal protein S6